MKKRKSGSRKEKKDTFPLVEPERLVPSAQGEALGLRCPIEATLKGSFNGVARTPGTALSGPNRFADPRSQAFGLG